MSKIVFDLMGGDAGPGPAVNAASQFIRKHPEVQITLVGDRRAILSQLKKTPIPATNYQIINASQISSSNFSDPLVIRTQLKSSLLTAIRITASTEVNFMITSGPTVGLIAGCVLEFGLSSTQRHLGFLGIVPNFITKKQFVMIDLGATLKITPQQLVQYARLGKLVCQQLLNQANPRIGLLNIGSEPTKGQPYQKVAYQLLQSATDLNFIGNLEPHLMLYGQADVVVCDGYSGNLVYKAISGALKAMAQLAGQIAIKTIDSPPDLEKFSQQIKTILSQVNGTVGIVTGIPGLIFKIPGRSQVVDFMRGLEFGYQISQSEHRVKDLIYLQRSSSQNDG